VSLWVLMRRSCSSALIAPVRTWAEVLDAAWRVTRRPEESWMRLRPSHAQHRAAAIPGRWCVLQILGYHEHRGTLPNPRSSASLA